MEGSILLKDPAPMTPDHTEQQSSDAKHRAKQLSLKSTTPPIEVPGYETQKFLGSGAFGEVWLGIDQNTGRRVAIKFYTYRGAVDWTLLSREVEKLAVLAADQYVVQLLDVGWDSDPPYYVMDYIDNGSLEDLLKAEGTLPLHKAVDLFREVAVGLMHLHGKGVLHCDLKPANVLLDEHEKPRLADFGQSRLSHEQKPALGTLFFMAPEQANLEAVPDARWDVYALGALLYCMLTGEAPFRTDEVTERIESTMTLADRLEKYRKSIETAPRPDAHRSVDGTDRGLNEIVDRCLAVDPTDRFPSVQSVLEALHERDQARLRKPLLMMGVLVPLVFLFLMVYMGITNYRGALEQAHQAGISRVRISNKFVADAEARAIRQEVKRFFAAVEREAERPELHDKIRTLLSGDDVKLMLEELNVPYSRKEEVASVRQAFLELSAREELHDYLHERIAERSENEDPQAIRIASMFVMDMHGTILAVAYETPQASKSEGRNYAFRTYFHDNPQQFPKDKPTSEIQPIEKIHLSGAFQSTTTGTWKIGVSTPLVIDEREQGIIVLTIELMHFTPFRDDIDTELAGSEKVDNYDHFAVLVDGRKGEEGTILHHPLLITDLDADDRKELTQYHVNLQPFVEQGVDGPFIYEDPYGKHEKGKEQFDRRWIAAMTEVKLYDEASGKGVDTGLRVIVQESYEETVKPLQTLGRRLLIRGLMAFVVFALVVSAAWYFVVRMLSPSRSGGPLIDSARRTTDSVHSMETIAAPRPVNPQDKTTPSN